VSTAARKVKYRCQRVRSSVCYKRVVHGHRSKKSAEPENTNGLGGGGRFEARYACSAGKSRRREDQRWVYQGKADGCWRCHPVRTAPHIIKKLPPTLIGNPTLCAMKAIPSALPNADVLVTGIPPVLGTPKSPDEGMSKQSVGETVGGVV